MFISDRTRYGFVALSIHWLTAVLVLVAFIYGPGGPEQRIYDPSRDFDRALHETLGLSVFTLVIIRVLWRLVDVRPESPPVARWMDVAARAVQVTLYLLMFALPISAVSGAFLEGHTIMLLGGIEFTPLFAESHDIGELISEIHGWLGDAILWLAGLHATAALLHHFLLKDQVLASMLPRWLLHYLPGAD